MTSRKQNNTNKPLTPSISAAFNRSSKPPLTPRLANVGGFDNPPKRLASPDQLTPYKGSAPTASTGPFLTTNSATPRSSLRLKNPKPESGLSSPVRGSPRLHHSRSPSGSSQVSVPASHAGNNSGRGNRKSGSPVRAGAKLDPSHIATTKPMDMLSPRIGRVPRPHSMAGDSSDTASMFFHASDAKSTRSESPDVKQPRESKPATTFMHADGRREEDAPVKDSNTTAPMPRRRRSSRVPRIADHRSPSVTSSPQLMSLRLPDSFARSSDDTRSMPEQPQADEGSDPESRIINSPVHKQINGLQNSVVNKRHMKTSSMDSANRHTPSRELRPSPLIISPSASHSSHDAIPPASAAPHIPSSGLRPRILSNSSNVSSDTHTSHGQSPSKSEKEAHPDKEVSSRIGRKIMDLEISNSSLLAINRTLEREMRKQNAELRRFRRLSRAGHFSMPHHTSKESSLPTTNEDEAADDEAVDDEAVDDQPPASDEEENLDSSDNSSSDSDSDQSQESNSEKDARLRVGDEKKVYTDLARHQELLESSRKMNHSLKRCLGWTEELIKEGHKALVYKVPPSDVKLGGRVLLPEEVTGVEESSHGLLSASSGVTDTYSDVDTENEGSTDQPVDVDGD